MIARGRQHGKTAKDVKTFVGTMTTEGVSPLLYHISAKEVY